MRLLQLQFLSLALWSVLTAAAADVVTVSVTRRDLRPLPGVTLQLAGAVSRQELTDENGSAAFDLPLAGPITITPSRSGFRLEPAQRTVDRTTSYAQ